MTDSSNLVPDVVRNKIRLEVLPLLQTINPAASENIAKTAQRMAEAEKVFNASVASFRASVTSTIDTADLLKQPSPEYLLYELLTPLGFTPSQVEQTFEALTGPSGRTFQSPTHELVIDRGRLVVEKRQEPLPTLRIPEPGTYCYHDDRKFRITLSDDVVVSRESACATLDADKVDFPLIVRPVQAGDRFQPFGMKGTRLVSDYLTDLKYTIFEKRRQLVVCDAHDQILWLVGLRTDQRFAIDGTTRRMMKIEN